MHIKKEEDNDFVRILESSIMIKEQPHASLRRAVKEFNL